MRLIGNLLLALGVAVGAVGVGIVQWIDSTFAVPDTLAFRCVATVRGVSPRAAAVLFRTTPEVATCASVAMFGTMGVDEATMCGSTSTCAVDWYALG